MGQEPSPGVWPMTFEPQPHPCRAGTLDLLTNLSTFQLSHHKNGDVRAFFPSDHCDD